MRDKYKKEFEEKDYPEIKSNFLTQTTAYISQHMEEIVKQVTAEISEFMKNIAKVQKVFPVSVGCIQVSIQHTSVYLGKPMLHMAAYVVGTPKEEEFACMDVPADWLFSKWDSLKKELEMAIRARKAQDYINEEDIRLYQLEQLQFLVLLMLSVYKYIYCDAEKIEGYKEMERREEFLITAGLYQDMQMVLYWEKPEIDIFHRPEEVSLEYGVYKNKIYRNKKFQKLNLKHAKFIECDFWNCEFAETELADTQFLQCRFYDTKITDSTLYGCYMEECVWKKTDFIRTKWFYHPEAMGRMEDNYRNVCLYQCSFSNVQIEDSDLTNVNQIGCSMEQCQLLQCCMNGSNLKEE